MSTADPVETPACPCENGEQAKPSGEEEHFIGAFEVAPHFMKDNDKITDGYRINFKTTTSIIKSMFMLHNESVNIWTHCLPAFFLIFFLVSFWLVIDANDFTAKFR